MVEDDELRARSRDLPADLLDLAAADEAARVRYLALPGDDHRVAQSTGRGQLPELVQLLGKTGIAEIDMHEDGACAALHRCACFDIQK